MWWWKVLLSASLVSVVVCGTTGGSENEVSPNQSPFLTEREAKSFIKHSRRARGLFDLFEIGNHDLEHECIKEYPCSYEEVHEVFEDDEKALQWLHQKALEVFPCTKGHPYLPPKFRYVDPKPDFGPRWRGCYDVDPETGRGTPIYDCPGCISKMYLLDGSASIGEEGFEHAKQYIVDAIDGSNCSNVGMVHCRCESDTSVPLDKFDDVEDVQDAVKDVNFTPSPTRIGYCIKHMQCTTPWPDDVPRVVVVLTDGQIYGTYDGKHTEDVAGMAQTARDAGMELYAGAIGRSIFVDEAALETIAGSEDRVFSVIDEDPSWLTTMISVEYCSSCSALANSIKHKLPYPWEDDTGPNEGQCIFKPRQMQQVCNALTTAGCVAELKLCHRAFWGNISALWNYTTDHLTSILHDVNSRVEELIRRLEESISNVEASVRDTTETAISEVRSAIATIIDASTNIIPDLADIVDGILENVQDLICSLIDKSIWLYGKVQEYFAGLIEEIFQPFSDSVSSVYDGLVSTVNGLLSSLPSSIVTDLEQILQEVRYILGFKAFDWVFGGGLDSLICRFLWWLIRPNRIPFTYPVPYEIPGIPPLPPLPPVPTLPPY